jgi:salicylate hydroxylase
MDTRRIEVAIIGGGITGITLAAGLLCRDVKFTVYERAPALQETGAGIGFTPNAERAMVALDPRLHQCFRNAATRNDDDWFRYVDGFKDNRSGLPAGGLDELICNIYLGDRGFEACRRSDFHRDIVGLIPQRFMKFGKNLIALDDSEEEDFVVMTFQDGSVEKADIGRSMVARAGNFQATDEFFRTYN